MATLGIDLQDGFVDAHVRIRVNEREVVNTRGVRTALLTGVADTVEVEVGEGDTVIDVSVDDTDGRSLHRAVPLTVSQDTYLGISVTGDGIDAVVRHEPFGYG